MKKLTILLGLVAALFAGYGAWWHQIAGSAQEKLEKALSKMQEELAPHGALQYDAIDKGGFPFDVSLTLTNPRLTYDDADAGDTASAVITGKLAINKKLWNDTVELTAQGQQRYSYQDDGDSIFKIELDGDTTIAYKGDIEGIFKLQVGENAATAEGPVAHWQSFSGTWDRTLISTPGATLQNGPSSIALQLDDHDREENSLRYRFKFKDLTVTGDNTPAPSDNLVLYLINFLQIAPQDYGNINATLEGRILFPPSHQWESIINEPLAQRNGRVSLIIDHFDMQSDLIDSTLDKGELSLTQKGADYTLRYDLKGTGTNHKQYDLVLKQKVENLLRDDIALQIMLPDNAEAQDVVYEKADVLAGLLPQFHRWGPITSAVDLTVTAKVENKMPESLNIELPQLSYETSQHALSLSGDYQSEQTFRQQHGSCTLQVTNYQSLLEEIAQFYGKIAQTLNGLQLASLPPLPLVRPGDVEDVQQFLKDISDHGAARDHTFTTTITYDMPNGLHIGRMDAPQFMERWQRLVMAIMERHLSAANTP